jgi:hypothetical protein
MNEQVMTCHDCYSFKWKNLNTSLIMTSFIYCLTHFLANWIMITPTTKKI